MALGRNDPCPCGSGKKYKKCCLFKTEEEPPTPCIDIASSLHFRALAENLIPRETANLDFPALVATFQRDKHVDLCGDTSNAQANIKKLSSFVEQQIASLCAQFPAYELLFWYRRIKPINKYNTRSAYNYHELIKLAIFAFGTKADIFAPCEGMVGQGATPHYIANITRDNLRTCRIPSEVIRILSALCQLEDFCFFYINLANCNRTLIKGGVIVRDKKCGITVNPANDMIARLIRLYDARLSSQSLLTTIGSYSVEQETSSQDEFCLPYLQYNLENHDQGIFANLVTEGPESNPNFDVVTINIHDYYLVLRQYNEVLKTKHGFEAEDILAILICQSRHLLDHLRHLMDKDEKDIIPTAVAVQILQRAYSLYEDSDETWRDFTEAVKHAYVALFPELPRPSNKALLAARNYLFFSFGQYDSLETELLKGFMFVKMTKDKVIVDYTSMGVILKGLVSEMRTLDGSDGNIASTDLEMKTERTIKSKLGDAVFFKRGVISTRSGQKKEQKEIDSSFILDKYLFVIECKSLSVSDGSIFGDEGALRFRTGKMKEYLKEANDKVDFICRNCGDLSVNIPETVQFVVPLVLTSFPEYIWEESVELFLTDTLPRFIVIDDIAAFADRSVIQGLEGKPYVRHLERAAGLASAK